MKNLFIILSAVLLLAGCSSKVESDMASLGENGKYNYLNESLGFRLELPKEFQYYQTQRIKSGDYIDVEFFVPTSDRAYPQEVSGYAKPFAIRVFNKKTWDEKGGYKKLGEKKDGVFSIKFWDKVPADWAKKWNREMGSQIAESFKLE